ncbi:NAD-dependent epimerase/dehydratase family protein [Neisseriaceae bacterium TC5R-5]|nr:NAD-dependent epimerase/dehydratase family protein [Neisseriaceae bacterium TC5R-5]
MQKLKHPSSVIEANLVDALAVSEKIWPALADAKLLLTGGTGFIGCWMLELLLAAQQRFGFKISVDILARHPQRLLSKAPHLASQPGLRLITADILKPLPLAADYSHIIHAAAETNVALDNPTATQVFQSAVEGTRQVLNCASQQQATRFLLLSSGAIYGPAADRLFALSESDSWCATHDASIRSAYIAGKRAAEFICTATAQEQGFTSLIARCFTVCGPYMPLRSGFALGNFIADVLDNKPIAIQGDGTAMRSYMYGSDMAVWLWTLLITGKNNQTINLGSDRMISIENLAKKVALIAHHNTDYPIFVAKTPLKNSHPEIYVPNIELAAQSLNLHCWIGLDQAIADSFAWARLNK